MSKTTKEFSRSLRAQIDGLKRKDVSAEDIRKIIDNINSHASDLQSLMDTVVQLQGLLFSRRAAEAVQQRILSIMNCIEIKQSAVKLIFSSHFISNLLKLLAIRSGINVKVPAVELLKTILYQNYAEQDRVFSCNKIDIMQLLSKLLQQNANDLTVNVLRLLVDLTKDNILLQKRIGNNDFIMSKMGSYLDLTTIYTAAEAVSLVRNLCQLCPDNRIKLGISGGILISRLIMLLNNSGNIKLQASVLHALSNLSKDNQDNRNAAVVAGCIDKCLELLDSDNMMASEQALKMLSRVIEAPGLLQLLSERELMPKLVAVLNRYSLVANQESSSDMTQLYRQSQYAFFSLRVLLESGRKVEYKVQLRAQGGIRAITQLLSSKDINVQALSVKVVGLAISDNLDNCRAVDDAGLLPQLRVLLESGSPKVQYEAVRTLDLLAQGYPQIQVTVNTIPIIPALLAMLARKEESLRLIKNVLAAIQSTVVGNKENEAYVCGQHSFPMLMCAARFDDSDLQTAYANLLIELINNDQRRSEDMIASGLMKQVLGFINSAISVDVLIVHLHLLQAMLCREYNRSIFKQLDGIKTIYKCLTNKDLGIVSAALACIPSACDHHLENPMAFKDSGIYGLLLPRLDSDNIAVRRGALAALNSIIYSSPGLMRPLKTDKIMRCISYCFSVDDIEVKRLAAELLGQLTDKDKTRSHSIRKLKILPDLISLLSEKDAGIRQYTLQTIMNSCEYDLSARVVASAPEVLDSLFSLSLDDIVGVTALMALSWITYNNPSSTTYFLQENRIARFITLSTEHKPQIRYYALNILDNLGFSHEEHVAERRRRVGADALHQFSFIRSEDFRYNRGENLGEGSFATVHLGTWRELPVVVKRLKYQELVATKELMDGLLYEGALMMSLRHPNIVHVIGLCTDEGNLSILMEYLVGGTLLRRVQDAAEELTWNWRYRVASQVAEALSYLHDRGVIHRDIKGDNILIDQHDVPKLTDFGLSRVVDSNGEKQCTEAAAIGTLVYCAPELREGSTSLTYTAAVDMYSFGMVLYEMATGERPLEDKLKASNVRNNIILKLAIINAGIDMPTDIPPTYSGLLADCWKKRAGDRVTARDAVGRLNAMIVPD